MELFDIVNKKDEVIGTTDKPTSHSTGQLHRVVAVYVLNNEGELYVQVHKKSGGLFDHSVGGHVSKGEDYVTAVVREAEEELGIKQPIPHLSTFYSDEGRLQHMFGLFECVASNDWHFVPNDEVETIIPMRINNVREMMTNEPHRFTPGFINTMKEYCKVKGIR